MRPGSPPERSDGAQSRVGRTVSCLDTFGASISAALNTLAAVAHEFARCRREMMVYRSASDRGSRVGGLRPDTLIQALAEAPECGGLAKSGPD